MSSGMSEAALLRRELQYVWKLVAVIMDAWLDQSMMFIDMIMNLKSKLAEKDKRIEELEAKLKDVTRQLRIHENCNNPDRNTLTAKKRQEHRKKLQETTNVDDNVAVGAAGNIIISGGVKKRGGQKGREGTSSTLQPDRSLDAWYAPELCVLCKRTDIIHLRPDWKRILEARECRGLLCHMEISVPALCLQCGIIIFPQTPSIPGTACGPHLRELMTNMHEAAAPVYGIKKMLDSNHGITIRESTASKCISAMSKHAENGALWEKAPDDMIAAAEAAYGISNTKIMPEAHSEPPVAGPAQLPETIPLPKQDREDSPPPNTLPVLYVAPDTHQQPDNPPPLLCQITELLSMAPYVMFDESVVKVAGLQEVALAALAPNIAAIIRITDNKRKETIRYEFQTLLHLPLLGDMYLAGNSFESDMSTCRVHVWRKGENLAVIHGIDSPEQTYSAMHLGIYRQGNDAASRILQMAGGPLESICEVAGVMRKIPGLEEYVTQATQTLTDQINKLIYAYRYGEVSDPESRKFATSLENALPYMFTFLQHPGMKGHTNDIETLIKSRIVRPRRMQVSLPDWAAAKNKANLQTIHANAAIWGVSSGQIVSGCRGDWTRPQPKTNMIMSPPTPSTRYACTPTVAADPAIQAHETVAVPRGNTFKAVTA